MPIREFLSLGRVSPLHLALLAALAAASGVLQSLLIALLGESLRHPSAERLGWRVALFVAGALLHLAVLAFVQSRVVRLAEQVATSVRLRCADAVLGAAMVDNENVPLHVKQAALGRDATLVAGAVPTVVGSAASLATIVGALAYLFYLSPSGAAVVCAVIAAAVMLHRRAGARVMRRLAHALHLNDRFFRFSDDLIRGTKELKLDSAWARTFMRRDVHGTLAQASAALTDVKVRQQGLGLVSTGAFFLLIGLVVFLQPLAQRFDAAVAASFALTLVYLNVPIQNTVARLPTLGDAAVALRRIDAVLRSLDPEPGTPIESMPADAAPAPAWHRLELRNVSFRYPARDAPARRLVLEDVNLTVRRGDLVFIVGGNGSGKTTLAKIVLGLYAPTAGEVLVDGVPASADPQRHRDRFSAVFSDPHLFARELDAMDADARERLDAMLGELALVPCVAADGRLDPSALSQGQRKRLALALAHLGNRQLQFFDEWPADQDPEFRARFYDHLLPRLQAEGRTLFVISHDERYFARADLLVRLDGGRVEVVRQAAATATA